MNSVDLTDLSAIVRKQSRLIRLQRVSVLLLLPALIGAGLYARSEKRIADIWRADALFLQSRQALPVVGDSADSLASKYYAATLIGEDGSQTSLAGKALQINLGGDKLLEIELERQDKDHLSMWAPTKRKDDFFHAVVFHPYCANAYGLEHPDADPDAPCR